MLVLHKRRQHHHHQQQQRQHPPFVHPSSLVFLPHPSDRSPLTTCTHAMSDTLSPSGRRKGRGGGSSPYVREWRDSLSISDMLPLMPFQFYQLSPSPSNILSAVPADGKPMRKVSPPWAFPLQTGVTHYFSIEKARRDFGYDPRSGASEESWNEILNSYGLNNNKASTTSTKGENNKKGAWQ